MAKSPAINWYFDNWLGGTKGMSRIQKACYFDLLAAQYFIGRLSLEQIKNELGADFHVWQNIKHKFKVDESGNYYNDRMNTEIERRKSYSKKQSDRVKNRYKDKELYRGKYHGSTTDVPVNETESDIVSSKEGGTGETKPKPPDPIGSEVVQKAAHESFNNKIWVENTCMAQSLSVDDLKRWMAMYNASISNDAIAEFDSAKYRKMFGGWLNKQKAKGYSLQKQDSQRVWK